MISSSNIQHDYNEGTKLVYPFMLRFWMRGTSWIEEKTQTESMLKNNIAYRISSFIKHFSNLDDELYTAIILQ